MESATDGTVRRRGRAARAAGLLAGVVLLLAAIGVVVAQHEALLQAWGSLRSAPAWLIGVAVLLPAGNWLAISCSFWVLTRPYARVPLGEMSALIAHAWLLNYLPLRPGMVGRFAYHKLVHGMRVRDAARVVLTGAASTGLVAAVLVVVAAALGPTAGAPGWIIALVLIGALICGAALWAAMSGRRWHVLANLVFRYLDMLVWTARWAVVMALVGQPAPIGSAIALAAVSQLAMSVPAVGNGLGLREWGIGLTAGLLPAWYGSAGAVGMDATAMGVTAGLLDRAIEMAVATVIGVVSAGWLGARVAGRGARRR